MESLSIWSLAGVVSNSAVIMAVHLSTQRVWHTFNYDVTVSNGVNLCHPAYFQSSDYHMKGAARPHLNLLNFYIDNWMPMPTGNGENLTDSERFKTPKTDFLLKFYKDKEFYQLGFQVC